VDVDETYDRWYGGDKSRRAMFDALAARDLPARVLYPGSFVHVTASFVFPSVTYVDTDERAARFFAQTDAVAQLVSRHKAYPQDPEIAFHGCSYDTPLPEPDGHFDLLVSLYAGFISAPCKRYLAVGGLLAVNNSHGDAGLAHLDPDYELVGAFRGRRGRFTVDERDLDRWFVPKRADLEVTEAFLRELGRGLGYVRSAPAYLFRRTR
jgi:hypothetical protein